MSDNDDRWRLRYNIQASQLTSSQTYNGPISAMRIAYEPQSIVVDMVESLPTSGWVPYRSVLKELQAAFPDARVVPCLSGATGIKDALRISPQTRGYRVEIQGRDEEAVSSLMDGLTALYHTQGKFTEVLGIPFLRADVSRLFSPAFFFHDLMDEAIQEGLFPDDMMMEKEWFKQPFVSSEIKQALWDAYGEVREDDEPEVDSGIPADADVAYDFDIENHPSNTPGQTTDKGDGAGGAVRLGTLLDSDWIADEGDDLLGSAGVEGDEDKTPKR